MSNLDPVQINESDDKVSELPPSPNMASPSHHPHDHQHSSYTHKHTTNRHVNTSHVDLDFFDPSGVHALERTLSHMSTGSVLASPHRPETPGKQSERKSSSNGSDSTLGPGDGPFDFEKTLRTVMKKFDESDIVRRELGVVFEDLRVVGLGAAANFQPTLGSTLNPLNVFKTIESLRHPATRDILSGFEGVLRPGEMLLVLGRPGAGCSSLLRILANQRHDFYAVDGTVQYDSFTPEELSKHYRGDVQYCPEDDVHFPTLTVGQTLSFAAKTRTSHTRIDGMSREETIEHFVNIVATIFGLRHVLDTFVGDASVRGVSGGEKKRVSIAEACATRSCLNSWDNSTRGLDSSTALEFVQALRIATDIGRSSTIVSIYQAGESLYKLFDKVCVIYDGKMAYYGSAHRARQYFIDMGFEPANRQTTADFLVAVTDPKGRIIRSGFQDRTPRNAIEFADHFKKSDLGRLNREDMDSYRGEFMGQSERMDLYKQSVRQEHAKGTNKKSPFITSIPMQIRALMVRRVQILRGSIAAQAINVGSFVLQAVIMGTVFLRVEPTTSTFFSRGGVLFFALLFAGLSTMSEIPALFSQRPIVLRQSRAAMYHPFIDSLALTLVDVPITAITMSIFSVVLYFLVGLTQEPGQFFIFLLMVFSVTLTLKAFFRGLAAAFKSPAPAQAVAGFAILLLVLYTGYSIPQPSMIGALRWITYINPLKYGFEALMVNEFHTLNATCSSLVPSGAGYESVSIANQVCTTVGSQTGQSYVIGSRYVTLSFGYTFGHLWRNFGIVCVFCIGFIVIYLGFTQINTSAAAETEVMMFKRGSKSQIIQDADTDVGSIDEEKPRSADSSPRAGETNMTTTEKTPSSTKPVDTFSWQHLNYTVPIRGGVQRRLLDDVSGYVAPGKLTALMGESGAGKTTLLNVLAQRTTTGVIGGDCFVNGQPLPIDFQAQSGYCQQMDTHLPTTTVREALLFSAKLRQPRSVPVAEKEAYVEECLQLCGLSAYADAIVGTLGVEHRKRTTIGVELAAKPGLLIFADEPTSGLDSQSAWAIVSFLRDLADHGQAILCTIHQPSAELFQVFDRILLLRKGGQTVYFGDIGPKSTTLIQYFEKNGARKCEEDENPAEYILSAIGAGATATTEIDWSGAWNNSPQAEALQHELENIHTEGRNRPPVVATVVSEFATSWPYQLIQLVERDARSHWRDPVYLMAKLALNITAGLFIGFTFWQSKNSAQGTQNKLFSIFMSTIISVAGANQLQVPFIATRNIYEIRERPSRMYSWTALLTSQIIVEVPWNMVASTLFFFCWFWTVGFESHRAGYTYLFLCVVFPVYYTTIGQAVAAMSPNAEIAALLFSFLFSFVLTFNGVMQPFSQLGWWRWMYRLSPYTYLIEGLLGQAIGKLEVECASLEYATLSPPSGQTCSQYMQQYIAQSGGYLQNPDATSDCSYCAYRTTDEFLERNFNIFYSHRWRNVGIFCAFAVFNIAAMFLLTYFFRIRTGSIIGSMLSWIKRRIARKP